MNVGVDVGTALKNFVLSGWRVMMMGIVDTALKKTSAGDVGTALKKVFMWAEGGDGGGCGGQP